EGPKGLPQRALRDRYAGRTATASTAKASPPKTCVNTLAALAMTCAVEAPLPPMPAECRSPMAVATPERVTRLQYAMRPGREAGAKRWKVAGRLRAKRGSGGIAFLDVEARDAKVQAILDRGEMGDAAFDAALHLVNEGDWIGVSGYGMRSKRGEPSIGAERVT